MKKRLFIGTTVSIPEPELKEIKKEMAALEISGKWVEEHNLHFTYRFLGEVLSPFIPEISKSLRSHLSNVNKVETELKGLGVFPNSKHPKVLWIGISAPGIEVIKEAIDASLKPFGFKEEKQKFVPHVTVLRIKRFKHRIKFSNYLNRMKEHLFLKMTIKEVSLVESVLTSEGPIYKNLETVELG
ncbi:RNA 2',3'-cyclic phosphodiesterase [Desulfurobacterium sp.]